MHNEINTWGVVEARLCERLELNDVFSNGMKIKTPIKS
jgi:hypothetical protein